MERRVPDHSVRLLVTLANTVLGLALLVSLVWATLRIFHAVLVFCLGGLLAYALDPIVTRLRNLARGRLSRGGAVTLVLLAFLMVLAVFIAAAAGPTGRQVHELATHAPELRARADRLAASLDQWLARRHIPFRVATEAQQLTRLAHDQSEALARGALRAAGLVAEALVRGMLVLLVAVYFLVYSPELKQRLSKQVPAIYQRHFHGLRRDLNQILGGFIRGQLLLAAAMGLSTGLGCGLLRLPFPILIGMFVALASLIPVVGAYIGAVPAVLLALLDPAHPAAKLAWVVLLFFILNEAGSKILYPRLVGSATGLHEVLVLFVLLAGAEVGGIIGALLAVPMTALVGLLVVYGYRIWSQSREPMEPEAVPPVVEFAPAHDEASHPPQPPVSLDPAARRRK